MAVYKLHSADGFAYLYPANDADRPLLKHYGGASLKDAWRPIKVDLVTSDEHSSRLTVGDMLNLQSLTIGLSQRAVDVLGEMLERNGEALPLDCDSDVFYAYNATRMIAALDRENCDLEEFDDGRIIGVCSYTFHYDKLRDAEIFLLAEAPHLMHFVTDAFVNAVRKAKLRGFNFREVG